MATNPLLQLEQSKRRRVVIIGLLLFSVSFFFFVYLFSFLGERIPHTSQTRRERYCNEEGQFYAYNRAKEFVKTQLKAPASAEFGGFTDRGVTTYQTNGCLFSATGYVDAQNSFGAKIRSRYSVSLEFLPDVDRWRALDVTIDP